jgi:hypothetical protein
MIKAVMKTPWHIGDRFRVKYEGGFDAHLWNKTGTVLDVYLSHNCEDLFVKAAMDEPSRHPKYPFVVRVFGAYMLDFDNAVEKLAGPAVSFEFDGNPGRGQSREKSRKKSRKKKP